jgi:hypothetical protein
MRLRIIVPQNGMLVHVYECSIYYTEYDCFIFYNTIKMKLVFEPSDITKQQVHLPQNAFIFKMIICTAQKGGYVKYSYNSGLRANSN